jgi:hypothetical protein
VSLCTYICLTDCYVNTMNMITIYNNSSKREIVIVIILPVQVCACKLQAGFQFLFLHDLLSCSNLWFYIVFLPMVGDKKARFCVCFVE